MIWEDYKRARQFYMRHMGNRAYVVLGLKLLDGFLNLLGLSLFIPILGVLASGTNSIRLGDMKGFGQFAEYMHLADVEISLMETLIWIGSVIVVANNKNFTAGFSHASDEGVLFSLF